MDRDSENFENCFATTAEILLEKGLTDAANLLKLPDYKVGDIDYKNWNDETPACEVYLQIDAKKYARLEDKKDTLAGQINNYLSPMLVRETGIWYSVDIIPKVGTRANDRSLSRARTVADALDADSMHKEIERIEKAIDTDPALAVGSAKDLVESCCKTILKKRGIAFTKSDNLPQLTKALTREIKLVPDGIPDETKGADAIKRILGNLAALTAELRNLYGSGHERDGKHRGLKPRHARLAFASAVAFVDFVTETYHERIDVSEGDKPPGEGTS